MSRFASPTALLALACLLAGPVGAHAADTSETPASSENTDFDSARALVDAQKYDEALTALRRLDQQSPDNPDVLNLIGFSLRKTGKMEDAIDYYNRALALNPQHRGANEYLGELYLETKQPEKAKQRLEVLRQACGDCEELEDLQKQMERYAAQ
jgi:predicted Zn-dependent protease